MFVYPASMRISLVLAAAFCVAAAGCRSRTEPAQAHGGGLTAAAGDMPELARQGKLIFDQTPRYAPKYTGNRLSCNDCHLQSGAASLAAPMIDLAGLFPMFNKRAGHVISLQNRIQECFARSEAGAPPPVDSEEMRALVAYIDWLSRDGVKGKAYKGRGLVKLAVLTGDPVRGRAVYAEQCAACHGVDGAGVPSVLPALWGPNSYNDGAGMNNPAKMAAFVIANMPQNHPGTLTPQQAYDVATFVHSKPRPKFNQAYKSY